ncbi:AAA family ATPase [Draconibacterium halophilum]|uniref:AAA family ATPase n=1 Tax=Draconibacterium halophilum TaxID=2706887 RepID=A0A6C0R8E3_9BACT|nr:AAA family ATPase [Draconibacterium halophilum]QIA06429.1 AAA family ATPase [Draconibacterium halophilum]
MIRTANQRIEAGLKLPDINSLMGDIWQSGELIFFFGGTGTGKSILAVQVGDGLSKGEKVLDILDNECGPQTVLFLDFELSDKQFQVRYTNKKNNSTYNFSDRFLIVNIPFGEIYEPGKKLTEKIFRIIDGFLRESNATVLIVDNITALSGEDSKDGNVAMELMSYLDRIKREKGLSIMILGHTPKKFDYTPLTNSDLAGSSKLIQFADSAFAIGKSRIDTDFRYLIQTKFSRTKREAYSKDNVITIRKVFDNNCLRFQQEGTGKESEHISDDGDDTKLQAIALRNQGLTVRAVAEKIGVSIGTVSNWTKNTRGLEPFRH